MKRIWILLALGLSLLLLAGCAGLSYEELYTLPRASEDYYDLQEALSDVLEQGLSYLAPSAGARQEPVQLVDLDGDGVDEAVAFFRTADREVKIYILAQSEGVYTPAAVIDGAGSAVAAVEYADLNGSGDQELILTYQVSESVTQALQVYRYAGGEAVNQLTAGCSRYGLYDLDGDGLRELVCLTTGGAESPAVAECYDGRAGELRRLGEQHLRFSYDNLRRISQGTLRDGARGMLFSGLSAEGLLVTDVLTVAEEALSLVQPEDATLSAAPIHSYYVYPEDVDGDGAVEFPQTRQLPAYDDGSAAQWVIDWYSLDGDGACALRCTTYENFSEGWYLQLLPAWDEGLTIKAGDEEPTVSAVTLYRQVSGGVAQEILTIYTLRGGGRNAYAEEHSLTILRSDSDSETIFAMTLAAAEPWEGTATKAQVSELFHYRADDAGGDE